MASHWLAKQGEPAGMIPERIRRGGRRPIAYANADVSGPDRLARFINGTPSPLMDKWTEDAWADIRAMERAFGLPAAMMP